MIAALVLLAAAPSARQVIDLNQGWQFCQVPDQPTVWNQPDSAPRSNWKVRSVSSQETEGENAAAANAIDGDEKTFWHSEWSKRQAPYPHEIVIDLGGRVDAIGLRLLPRQTGPQNGRPFHYKLYLSNSLSDWGTPRLDAAVPDSGSLYQARFPFTPSHYMRLVFLDGHRPAEPFLALSEIGLIRQTSKSGQQDWQSQYNIASVQVGDARYDLRGKALEQVRGAETKQIERKAWQTATLPHAAWIRPANSSAIWQGVTYYRRSLDLTPGSASKHLCLTLEGAMQTADLWLNGQFLASHRGGYLPFKLDLTGKLKPHNELLVRLDNRDNPLVPPGKPQQELDFMYGNGLYRGATLTATDPLRITDPLLDVRPKGGGVLVTFPDVATTRATVRIRTEIRNGRSTPQKFLIVQRLNDASGKAVASSATPETLSAGSEKQFLQDLSVASPQLWSPDHPNLYRLETRVLQGSNPIDQVQIKVGIRKIEVSRQRGFVLNGKPLWLVGTNRHQDYPWVGPALSDAANARDAVLIKRAGHNIVRLSHYPQSPAFMDACDELGLLTIPCIPGWQFLNNDPRFKEAVRENIKNLIRRDRNHPCVAWWETSLNETYPPADVARDWNAAAKSEEVDGNVLTAGDSANSPPWDICYNGWNDDFTRPQSGAPDRPGYIREYGDYEFGGATSSSRVRIGGGMEKLLQAAWNNVWSYNRYRPQSPWTMGEGTWEMFDHDVPWEFAVSASGIDDLFRREKPSAWFYAAETCATPFLKIAATWQPGPAPRDIVVFTNCDSARLSINGKLVAFGKPKWTASTSYEKARPFDGSNTEHLAHPPIVFREVPFSAGRLVVEGLKGRKVVTRDEVRTAGKPAALKVWLDDAGVAPTQNDLVFVRAAVVDANGVICPDDSREVHFSVKGATFAGESHSLCEMGIASALVRTSFTPGSIVVRASGQGLLGNDCEFHFSSQPTQ